jgi:hypothetical protein
MLNLKALKISDHYLHNRTIRQEQINAVVNNNWGVPVKEEYYKGAYRVLTDTGLVFILTEDKTTIQTMYLARGSVVHGMMHGRVPKALTKRINENARRYQKLFGDSIRNSKNVEKNQIMA